MSMTRIAKMAILAISLIAWAFPAVAQKWPARAVHLVVPYAPGGNVDVAARIVAAHLQERLGQGFIIDNKPGAGGLIAADYVANAAADGYTFFVGANGPLLFMPVIMGRANFDWQHEFVAVGSLSFTPLVLQVQPSLGVHTIAEFLQLARKRDLNMGSSGSGSTNHLVSELLQSLTHTKWTTIHYKGNAPVVTALMSNEVDFSFDQVTAALPLIQGGRTIPLAVTSRTRFSMLPDVPTFEEAGFKDFEAVTWTGIFAPAKTPRPIVERFSAVLGSVLQESAVIKRFTDLGSDARAVGPRAFQEYVSHENAKWIPIIKQANIRAE